MKLPYVIIAVLCLAQNADAIDATGTKIDPDWLSPELRAKLDTEKPPGSKEWDKMIVLPNDKDKK